MQYLILVFLLAISLQGCDPSYSCYIQNTAPSDLYLKTDPPVESLIDQQSIYYDSILIYKVRDEDKLSVYEVKPNEVFRLFGHIGFSPRIAEIPFNYVEILQGNDTLVLDSKQKILDRLKNKPGTRKYFIR